MKTMIIHIYILSLLIDNLRTQPHMAVMEAESGFRACQVQWLGLSTFR